MKKHDEELNIGPVNTSRPRFLERNKEAIARTRAIICGRTPPPVQEFRATPRPRQELRQPMLEKISREKAERESRREKEEMTLEEKIIQERLRQIEREEQERGESF